MRSWTLPTAVCLTLCLQSVSDASHAHPDHPTQRAPKSEHHERFPSVATSDKERSHSPTTTAGRIEQRNVSVLVQPLDAEFTESIFDVDLLSKGIQPVVIELHNGSDQTYHFAKANVDAHYIPAVQAAKASSSNPIGTGIRTIGWLVSFIPVSATQGLDAARRRRPTMSRDIQQDYVKEEIADADLGPNGSLRGFVFVRPVKPGGHLTLKLINVKTQEPLVFEVPTQGQ